MRKRVNKEWEKFLRNEFINIMKKFNLYVRSSCFNYVFQNIAGDQMTMYAGE